MDDRDRAKRAAAAAGVARVRPGERVALGSGSTAAEAIRLLGERFRDARPALDLVASSTASERIAAEAGLTVRALRPGDRFDVMLDGADEVDPALRLTKGGGGALFREKLLARLTDDVVILIDEAKLVARLGDSYPIPVEIVPYALPYVEEAVRRLGRPSEAALRRRDGAPYRTDNGLAVLDLRFPGGLDDPSRIEQALRGIAGVVEVGIFVGLTGRVLVGRPDGSARELLPADRPGR